VRQEVDGEIVEQVDDYDYLGSVFSKDNSIELDISRRIQSAPAAH
jgi:hypothetical protein